MVRVVVASALNGGHTVKRPWLGAKLQPVTPEIADSMGLKRPAGALVANVVPAGPAAQAGLKAGDLIVSVDGQEVDDPNAFDYRFATKPLGGTAKLGILRAGKEMTVTLALHAAPDIAARRDRHQGPLAVLGRDRGQSVAGARRRIADPERRAGRGRARRRRTAPMPAISGSAAATSSLAVNGQQIDKTGELARVTEQPSRTWRVTIAAAGSRFRRCSADESCRIGVGR